MALSSTSYRALCDIHIFVVVSDVCYPFLVMCDKVKYSYIVVYSIKGDYLKLEIAIL